MNDPFWPRSARRAGPSVFQIPAVYNESNQTSLLLPVAKASNRPEADCYPHVPASRRESSMPVSCAVGCCIVVGPLLCHRSVRAARMGVGVNGVRRESFLRQTTCATPDLFRRRSLGTLQGPPCDGNRHVVVEANGRHSFGTTRPSTYPFPPATNERYASLGRSPSVRRSLHDDV
jgi:hypothetical protein